MNGQAGAAPPVRREDSELFARRGVTGPPGWLAVRRQIAWEIRAGILQPGDEVHASDDSLDYGTNPFTLNRALRSLADYGLIRIQGGNVFTVLMYSLEAGDDKEEST